MGIFKDIIKMGIVVKDISDTKSIYTNRYGITPWLDYDLTSTPVKSLKIDGEGCNADFILSVSEIDNVQIEIVQPGNGHSLFTEFLNEKGEGIAYLEYEVDDFENAYKYLEEISGKPILEGCFEGKGDFAYFDTTEIMKHYVKISTFGRDDLPDENGKTNPAFDKIFQIAMVVKDIHKTAKDYVKHFDIKPWNLSYFNKETVNNMVASKVYDNFNFVVATCTVGNVELEFMQSLDGDKGVYTSFLKEKGEGIHHVCMIRENSRQYWEDMDKRGLYLAQYGEWFGCSFVHMASESELKFSLELYDSIPGFTRPTPAEIIE